MNLLIWILVKIICYSIVLYKCTLIFYRKFRYYTTCVSEERWNDYNYNLAEDTFTDMVGADGEVTRIKNTATLWVDGAKFYMPLDDV